MSETKPIYEVPSDTRSKLTEISKKFSVLNTGSVGDNLWLASDNGDSSYEWTQTDMGVNKAGQLIFGSQGGCSCNGPDQPEADFTYDLGSKIEFQENYDRTIKPTINELIQVTDTLYETLTGSHVDAEAVLALPNVEIRRAVVELIGYDKIVDRAELLDESSDGRLLKIKQRNDEDIVLIHVKDPSTDREYFLRVPPTMKTAKEARAWTFGFEADDFDLDKES